MSKIKKYCLWCDRAFDLEKGWIHEDDEVCSDCAKYSSRTEMLRAKSPIMGLEETILTVKRDVDGCLTVEVGDREVCWKPSTAFERVIEKELKEQSQITNDMEKPEKELREIIIDAYKVFKEAQETSRLMKKML